jgi:hypothetical protein
MRSIQHRDCQGRQAAGFGYLVLACLLITGCAGMEPYEPRDERTEGPKRGLFSGDAGEIVIYQRGGTETE